MTRGFSVLVVVVVVQVLILITVKYLIYFEHSTSLALSVSDHNFQ